MAMQLSFVGDGRMGMVAGWQDNHVFVCFYDSGENHDMDARMPQPFKSMDEVIDESSVILNFTNAKSIDNLIATLEDAKAMLDDIDAFADTHNCDVLGGDGQCAER